MALLLKNGSVFLHVPKTGGNWVTDVLTRMGLVRRLVGTKHSDAVRTLNALSLPVRPTFRDVVRRRPVAPSIPKQKPFIFTFVRHPCSWYESWFKYQMQVHTNWRNFGVAGDIHNWHPNSVLNKLAATDFDAFVGYVQKHRPGYVSELLFSYTTPVVDFVGKQESIRDDLCTALGMAELDFDEDMVRASDRVGESKPAKPVCIRWSQSLRAEVLRNEWPSLLRYGYESDAESDPATA
jgi:hypothetical protein